ncbi:MAG: transglutaminase domain-containing protein [Acidimicrobiales bacterium]
MVALLGKVAIAVQFYWVGSQLPGRTALGMYAAAIVLLIGRRSLRLFTMSTSSGVLFWLLAVAMAPVQPDITLELRPSIILLSATFVISRVVLLALLAPASASSPKAARLLVVDAAKAAAMVAVVLLAVAPLMQVFGPPAFSTESIFTGEGDGAQPYWGFERQMDTASRGDLGDEIVMRVHADKPSFWRGQTFDVWDGRFWHRSDVNSRVVNADSQGHVNLVEPDLASERITQTFTMEQDGSDIVFGAPDISRVDHPVPWLYQFTDGSLRADIDLAAGSQYTVESSRPFVTDDLLRSADPLSNEIPRSIRDSYLAVRVTPRVAALAVEITAAAPTSYDKIRALEAWMAENITYNTDVPPLPTEADAVEQLLFVDKIGFCEQIGTSLAVMARSLGIPARLAVGYVPNEFDRLRGSWTVRARDAHAWTEIYFPGIGWQGFDPTAEVPLSGPRPAVVEESSRDLPVQTLLLATVGLGLLTGFGLLVRRTLRIRSASWEGQIGERLDKLGKAVGRKRRVNEGIARYAQLLGVGCGSDALIKISAALNRAQFAAEGLDQAGRLRVERLLDELENPRRQNAKSQPREPQLQ